MRAQAARPPAPASAMNERRVKRDTVVLGMGGCRVALKSETRRVRGYFLPLTMRFDCHRAYAFRALPGDVINRSKQTWLRLEGAQESNPCIVVDAGA